MRCKLFAGLNQTRQPATAIMTYNAIHVGVNTQSGGFIGGLMRV